jgi:hypothetical protein
LPLTTRADLLRDQLDHPPHVRQCAAAGLTAFTPLGVDMPALRYLSGLRGRLASECACGGEDVILELVT